jgi:membrane-associated PAP2 superfamily phosphatase
MNYFKHVFICLISLGIILTLIHYSDFDLKFQSLFFISEINNWLVDRNDLVLKFFLYRLPKYIIIIYGISLIFWGSKLALCQQDTQTQKKILYLVLSLILIPLIAATLKHFSPIHCPNFIQEFGGTSRHISPLEIFNSEIFFHYNGKCFPAGHASGGFALISLYFIATNSRYKIASLMTSFTLGWTMGLYQIAKGAHYLSDTIVTLAIAYLVSITLHSLIVKKDS